MNALALLMKDLHDGENTMSGKLRRAAHQHATDYDVRHGAIHLATWSQRHVSLLAEAGKRFDLDLSPDADDGADGVVQQVLDKTAEALGRRPEPALVLLKEPAFVTRRQGEPTRHERDRSRMCHPSADT